MKEKYRNELKDLLEHSIKRFEEAKFLYGHGVDSIGKSNEHNKIVFRVLPEDFEECEQIVRDYIKKNELKLLEKDVNNDNLYSWFMERYPIDYLYLKGYLKCSNKDRFQYVGLLKDDFVETNGFCPSIIMIEPFIERPKEFLFNGEERSCFMQIFLFDK